jgi:hypothetical protein
VGQVAAVNTPASAPDVLRALLNAGAPSNTAATMLAAQAALETAGFGGGLWNWNLGNITASGSADYVIQSSSNPLHFLAFDSLQAGADYFVSFLRKRGLLPFAEANDLQGYVGRLQQVSYVGSDPSVYPAYYAGMAAWIHRLGGVVASPGFSVKNALMIGGSALVLASAVAYAYDKAQKPTRSGRRRRSVYA